MKKIVIVTAIIVLIGGYVFYQHYNGAKGSPVQTQQPAANVSYKDGQYTGSVADAYYGNLQVAVTISGGKLTDVQFLTYPNAQGHTIQVSNESMPVLKSEAIAAQSANVNIVSGATQTSGAFIQSLGSALAQAQG